MVSPISPSSNSDIRQLLIIDSRVPDPQSLLAVRDSNTAVIYLNDQQDGLSQISAALQGYSQLDAVQIISHGSPASLLLGTSTIDTEGLLAQQTQLEDWRDVLSDDADILLYGCNVAQGEQGQAFVDTLAQLTGSGTHCINFQGAIRDVNAALASLSMTLDANLNGRRPPILR